MPTQKNIVSMSLPTPDGPVEVRLKRIASSNIDWIAWPKSGDPLMIVQFKYGGRYAYIGVPRQRAVACAYSESSGHYLATRIKPHFQAVKLRG